MKKINKILNSKVSKLSKIDYIIIVIIILLYSILSFINLGSFNNPQTFYKLNDNQEVVFEFANETDVIRIKTFCGEQRSENYLYYSYDNKEYNFLGIITPKGEFAWNDDRYPTKAKYIKLVAKNKSSIGEISFYDNYKKQIKIKSVSTNNKNIKELTDEQNLIPEQISYLNSSYFDEIYFARTAYNYLNNEETYEWTHPPLGKMIQAIPVILFNKIAPFYYRLMGNIAGIIMIFIMYLLGIELFKKRKWAIVSSLLMFFETSHFVQTRMGTVDSFLILFIMLAIYFMIRHITKKETKYNLFLSGLFFGLSMCVKWTGALGGLALAIIYFYDFIKNKRNIKKTLSYGTIYFVIIPLIIYTSIYFIYPKNRVAYTDSYKAIIDQTEMMYNYHSKLTDDHFFSSDWYTWPISYKPVWYYEQEYSYVTKGTITAIGNIAIWWLGIIAVLYLPYRIIKKKELESIILLITVLSLWLPYIFIGRVMFLYHYFPVVPFITLAVVKLLKDIEEKTKKTFIVPIYLTIVIGFFIIYYPVISGIPVSKHYIDSLKLLESWYF